MALQLSPQAVHVVLTSMVADASLQQFEVPLNPSVPYTKALEDAVYSTPALLADYGRVDIVVRNSAYTVVPPSVDAAGAVAAARCAQLAEGDTPVAINSDNADIARVAWTLPEDVANFVARTFRNAPTLCHLTPLLRYLSARAGRGNTAKLFAHFVREEVDIVVFAAYGSLLLAATHPVATDTDGLYFVMACARMAGLDLVNDEILLCGDAARRLSLMPVIGRYAAKVMPMIFPSAALRAGREAFKAPFPLILLPLCE